MTTFFLSDLEEIKPSSTRKVIKTYCNKIANANPSQPSYAVMPSAYEFLFIALDYLCGVPCRLISKDEYMVRKTCNSEIE